MPTGKMSADDILGAEHDWLASDADNHVGLFTTAGGGYAPEEYLHNIDAHIAAIEAILALPASTTSRFAPELSDDHVNTWRLVAERGLFAFDSDVGGGPYTQVAAPRIPIPATELPAIVLEVLNPLQYHRLHFATSPSLSADSLRRR